MLTTTLRHDPRDTHCKQLIGQIDSFLSTFGSSELVPFTTRPTSFFFLWRQLEKAANRNLNTTTYNLC